MWEHFEHQADIGVRGIGRDLNEAFAEGAYALMEVICDAKNVKTCDKISINCDADDIELLFADWLNALIREMSTENMLLRRFEVRIQDTHLEAEAWGEPVDRKRHDPAVEVKAATYMELRVGQNENGTYFAQCVVDV